MTFEEYLRRHGDALFRHAAVVCADSGVAEDLVQSVLERAFRQWERIAAMEFPDAYLRRMVVNEFLSLRRRLGRMFVTDRIPDTVMDDASEEQGDRMALIAELSRLPHRQRAAVALRYWAGLPDSEIAEQMGCAESTVRGYIFRALRTLRVSFEAERTGLESR